MIRQQPDVKSDSDLQNERERDFRNQQDAIYKSGIPTLRSSAYRIKFSPKTRRMDPTPKSRHGEERSTTWLPKELLSEKVFAYDESKHDLVGALQELLGGCNRSIVGAFPSDGVCRLEDFVLPIGSIWRSCNGGHCEEAQKYLSEKVKTNKRFLSVFDRLVTERILPYIKDRLIDSGTVEKETSVRFYYQRPPTLRLQPGPAWCAVKPHNDAEYGHQNGEVNFWIPLTDRSLTGVDLWCESSFKNGDYRPIPARPGEIIAFHGSSCRHYVNSNTSSHTRASIDFRVGVEGFFDHEWQMKGTKEDHSRSEADL